MKRVLLSLTALVCTACTAPLQGPKADLGAIATPDPLPPMHRVLPTGTLDF